MREARNSPVAYWRDTFEHQTNGATKVNRQEIFNTVYTHLLTQNSRCTGGGIIKSCMYRSPDRTRKCAIGALIPDEKYNPLMEGISISAIYDRDTESPRQTRAIEILKATLIELDIDLRGDFDLLVDLQGIHDGRDASEWQEELEQLADAYGLTIPELPNLENTNDR
jgi:hypothetical protein